ncbi:MAG TPA: membrane dipeptidase, partial [Longimicrobiales bacterium]|nr:membrane dipeptidase [Longimicrobiales bacterium]
IAHRMIQRYPEAFELALTADDAVRIFEEGKIASMLGMEGGHAIENSLGALRSYYDMGARYMTLTHSANIDWADSCCEEPELGGLSPFGEEVVREMNRLGMLVDLSHVSPETMNDVLDIAEAPVIFSHSSAAGVTPHPRNVPDQVLRRLPENGGVVMVTFVNSFVNEDLMRWQGTPRSERTGPAPEATMDDVIAHIEHVRDVAGIEHVALGGDYDGATLPDELRDVSTYPILFAELSRRGWTEQELAMLAGENVLRAWRGAEAASRRLQAERAPSTATIEEMDGLIRTSSGAFVTTLGRDTLALEQFSYTPTTVDAVVALRVPETSLTRYRGQMGVDGRLRTLTAVRLDPAQDGRGGEPLSRTVYRFHDDGVTVTRERDGDAQTMEVDATVDAIPFIDMVHWPYELGLVRMAAEGRTGALPMITGRSEQDFVITASGANRRVIRHPYRGTMDVQVDDQGRIQMLDAGNTTRAVVVRRVVGLPVAELARDFATRDRAGQAVGSLSGRAEVQGTIGGANIVVDHGVPRKRGRDIFGALVPFGEVWRTGADRATHLSADRDLTVGGRRVPAGTYTLFTIPNPEEWTLIISRATDINGQAYDPELDLARVPMDVRALGEPVEELTIVVDADGYLRLQWDETEAVVPVRAS